MICENETFLAAKESRRVYVTQKIRLWHIPKGSPDLNPIEKFWGWLRRELRRRDLQDLRDTKPPLVQARLPGARAARVAHAEGAACRMQHCNVVQEDVPRGSCQEGRSRPRLMHGSVGGKGPRQFRCLFKQPPGRNSWQAGRQCSSPAFAPVLANAYLCYAQPSCPLPPPRHRSVVARHSCIRKHHM